METIFKVGMKVWDYIRYPGIEGFVKQSSEHNGYGVIVDFQGKNSAYTLDGRWYKSWIPTLSVAPYEFKLPEQIVPHDFKKYDRVLVKDVESAAWEIDTFI